MQVLWASDEWVACLQIAVTYMGHEVNPFNGKPFFNEVVFCHEPSRTFITADFFWNYPSDGTTLFTRVWKGGMDSIYSPFYFNIMIKDRGAICIVQLRPF